MSWQMNIIIFDNAGIYRRFHCEELVVLRVHAFIKFCDGMMLMRSVEYFRYAFFFM